MLTVLKKVNIMRCDDQWVKEKERPVFSLDVSITVYRVILFRSEFVSEALFAMSNVLLLPIRDNHCVLLAPCW